MGLTIEAIYENGVLKPSEPLPFKEHEKLRITVQSPDDVVQRSYGIMGFKGTEEEADYFAMSPELDYPTFEEDE